MPPLSLWPPFVKPPTCTGCPRLNATAQGFVPGAGDASARLLVIGEQPGPREREAGKPFVGKSGEQLDAAIGGRESAYITNVRKCEGAERESDAVDTGSREHCASRYLLREVQELRAVEVILLVGADALDEALGIRDITKYHGSVWSAEEARAMVTASGKNRPLLAMLPALRVVVASLHPAFAMRGAPHFREGIQIAMRRAKAWVDKGGTPEREWWSGINLCASAEQIATAMEGETHVAMDVETPREAHTEILMVGLAPFKSKRVLVAKWGPDVAEVCREILESPKIVKVGHNFSFDTKAFYAYGIEVAAPVVDTIQAGALLWPPLARSKGSQGKGDSRWLSLAACVLRVFDGVPFWKEAELPTQAAFYRAAWPRVPDWLRPSLYCGLDVAFDRMLWGAQRELLIKEGMYRLYAEIVAPAAVVLHRLERRGMLLDVDARDRLRVATETLRAQREIDVVTAAEEMWEKRVRAMDDALAMVQRLIEEEESRARV